MNNLTLLQSNIYLIENNPDLSLFLGKKFELNNRNLFLGSNISHSETGNWEFISVIDNIYNFKIPFSLILLFELLCL